MKNQAQMLKTKFFNPQKSIRNNWRYYTNELREQNLPVIKISLDSKIIYGNETAITLLKEWKCDIDQDIPRDVFIKYPEITSKNVTSDVDIRFNDCTVKFTVVPFYEGGYIGLYAYEMETEKFFEQMITNPVKYISKKISMLL